MLRCRRQPPDDPADCADADLPCRAGRAPLAPAMNDRELLERLIAGPASGDALARASGLTRAAVWKRVAALREAGIAIAAQAGRGYSLARPLELLDADTIRGQLPPSAQPLLAGLEIAWTIDSTNSELLRRPVPATGALVLLAERQTGGRGRRGRSWVAPMAANLTLSLSRQFTGGLARLPGLSLVAGVATAEALHALGATRARLKWPNDLVVADGQGLRKLGGLLVEGGGEHAGPARAVLGLGLNLRLAPEQAAAIAQPWIDLDALLSGAAAGDCNGNGDDGLVATRDGPASSGGFVAAAVAAAPAAAMPTRNTIAATVIAHWLPALARFDAEGLAPFLERYACFDALAGREVTVQREDGAHPARALGLAPDGALRVLLDGREQRLHAGEISVRAA
jgi:BirA family biotin operon repressor/biotin-[acetyl-CoA-carboxylase] ligase